MINRTQQTKSRDKAASSHRGFGALLYDLTTLVELQGRLLLKDIAEMQAGAVVPIAMVTAGTVLVFATAPVLLLALGWFVAEFTGLPIWAAMVTSVSIAGIMPAGLLIFSGWKLLKNKLSVLQRSKNELTENARWLKHRIQSNF